MAASPAQRQRPHLRQGLGARSRALGLIPLGLLCSAELSHAANERIDRNFIVKLIHNERKGVKDANGWATDIKNVMQDLGFQETKENICSVIAIVSQESSFVANPQVPRLKDIAKAAAEEKIEQNAMLKGFFLVNPGVKADFLRRVTSSRTEKDLDEAYRWLSVRIQDDYVAGLLIPLKTNGRSVGELFEMHNPVRTIGSMQVSVSYAISEKYGDSWSNLDSSDFNKLRDQMYGRRWGLYYGVKQLLGYRASYSSRLFMFADYNSGRYSSRNAAFQAAVSELSGAKLALDGDLLIYSGRFPSSEVSETEAALRRILTERGRVTNEQLRSDLLKEKEPSLSSTETYIRVRTLYKARRGTDPTYETIPQILLSSPKIRNPMQTADFAHRVYQRYLKCIKTPP
jgi:hypothetical protein